MKDIALWFFFVLLSAVVFDAARDGSFESPADEQALLCVSAPHG